MPTGQETVVEACGNVPIGPDDMLQVDFFAHDPEGHLDYYTLLSTWGESEARDLLSLSGLSLLPSPLASTPVPGAAQVGPYYWQARLAGASAPTWHGGAIRLRVPAQLAFPETCCYQLELRAYKRTVVSCDYDRDNQSNKSEYSFMIVV